MNTQAIIDRGRSAAKKVVEGARYNWALVLRWLYRNFILSRQTVRRRQSAVVTLLGSVALIGLASAATVFRASAAVEFGRPGRLDTLTDLLLGVGTALIGGTAIAFSLILFAMQVNVERMPHGLFRRLSSDRRLLGAFVGSFALSAGVASASLVSSSAYASFALAFALGAGVLTLMLFLYAYRRALHLINPAQQLASIVAHAHSAFRHAVKWQARLTPVIAKSIEQAPKEGNRDTIRMAYFQANKDWDAAGRQAVNYAVSYARRFAEVGDYEIVRLALNSVVGINHLYIEAKGRTFFADVAFFDSPLARDSFLIATLEQLRLTVRTSLARGDEQQVEASIAAMAGICVAYAQIDYGRPHVRKSHAGLAAGYLESAVTAIIPQRMPDAMMEGVRQLGRAAQSMLFYGGPQDVVSCADKLGTIGLVGVASTEHRAVLLEAVEQLSTLTFELLKVDERDIKFASRRLRQAIFTITEAFLGIAEPSPFSSQSTYLAPYYSSTTHSAFRSKLALLTNALLELPEEDVNARRIVGHIEDWADQIFDQQKTLLLKAVEQRSHFTFDLIAWNFGIAEILMAAANVPAAQDHTKQELRKSALWLLSGFSWLPTDRDTVAFIENFQLTESLLEAVLNTANTAPEHVAGVRDILFSWGLKAGAHDTGWAILENALAGLAAAALMDGQEGESDRLKNSLSTYLERNDAPPGGRRDRAARELRRMAESIRDNEYELSILRRLLAEVDHEAIRSLLRELADILSPATAGERVQADYF